jgi:hypothetical protein
VHLIAENDHQTHTIIGNRAARMTWYIGKVTVVVPAPTGTSDGSGKPGGRQGFRPDIQGLRAIAVAMVVI